jgi:tyrosyl-tRNA synthetase
VEHNDMGLDEFIDFCREVRAEPVMAAKLLLACNLVESGGEGKRMIKQGGVSINERRISDPNETITPVDGMVVQVGRRRFARITVK